MRKCQSCENDIDSIYCPHCGEKEFQDSDLSVKSILKELEDMAFSLNILNTKFGHSAKKLIGNPGEHTNDYCRGVRVPNYTPLKMFLFINFIFYIFLKDTVIFYSTFSSMKDGYTNYFSGKNFLHYDVYQHLYNKTQLAGSDLSKVQADVDSVAGDESKFFLLFLVPLFSIPIYLFYKGEYYIRSYVIAMNFVSIFTLFSIICFGPVIWLHKTVNGYIFATFIVVNILHFIFTLKNNVEKSWLRATISGITLFGIFWIILSIYKQAMLVLSIKLWPAKGILDYFAS
ncbi:DUF3667 domain-containing protein [Chitinophagaceae bacterium MMS25-I14]